MATHPNSTSATSLHGTSRSLVEDQLRLFTLESVHARTVMKFDPTTVIRSIEAHEGREVISIDIGGEKLTTARFIAVDGSIVPTTRSYTVRSERGWGYLNVLEWIAEQASSKSIPVGISCAGLVKGTSVVTSPNAPNLLQ